MTDGPFAKAGDLVTCQSGHEICEVACDLVVGETITGSAFGNWKFPISTKYDTPIPMCPVCREPFIWLGKLHVNGKWEPGCYENYPDPTAGGLVESEDG